MTSSTKSSIIQLFQPSLITFGFIGFAFLISVTIVVSMIPFYIENKSIEKTKFVLTTVRFEKFFLLMNRSLMKRNVIHSKLTNDTKDLLTFEKAQAKMNLSIQYALEQQLKLTDNRDKLTIYITKMTPYTNDLTNMSVLLDFYIIYTRECKSCNKQRQMIIYNSLCSNNKLSIPIRLILPSTDLSYTLSDEITVYTSYTPLENIIVTTEILSISEFIHLHNTIETDQFATLSSKLKASNYTLIIATTKTNYIATLDETISKTSANPNDGPVSLVASLAMYPGITQIIEQNINSSNLNITINQINLNFWYSNSTIQVIIEFLINFSTACEQQCMNQRRFELNNSLSNINNIQINIQPANLSDGKVNIYKKGVSISYDYSLTVQVISNITGTINHAISPIFDILY